MLQYKVREESRHFPKFNTQSLLRHDFNSDTSSCLLLQHLCIQAHRCYIRCLQTTNLKPPAWDWEWDICNLGIKERTQCSHYSIHFKALSLFSVSGSTLIFRGMCALTLGYTRKIVEQLHSFLLNIYFFWIQLINI